MLIKLKNNLWVNSQQIVSVASDDVDFGSIIKYRLILAVVGRAEPYMINFEKEDDRYDMLRTIENSMQ